MMTLHAVTTCPELLKEALDLPTLRSLLSYPTWGLVVQAICRTRSYQAGLEGGLLLMRRLETARELLSAEEFEHHWKSLAYHHLNMLDKLDRWEEYLETWDSIRTSTRFAVTYAKDARRVHHGRIDAYILGEDAHTLRIHFLYSGSYRREVIERKLARKQAGKKLGNLYHGVQSDLSPQEVQQRLDQIRQFAFTFRRDPI